MQAPTLRQAMGFVARRSWVRKIVLSTPLIRDVAWRFVAGEDLAAGLTALHALKAQGITGTLNYVGTHVHDRAEAVAAADAIVKALTGLAEAGLEPNVSVKLTQIGFDIDDRLCRDQLNRILDRARTVGGFVRIDMEESAYVERTIELFEEVRAATGPETVGIVVQSYLRDRAGDLDRLIAGRSRIRIVKGGYWEAPTVVHRAKAEIDAAFLRDIETLLRRADHPALATHDPDAVTFARRIAEEAGLDRRAFEFQMLYGVATDLQARLVADGYAVRCYVPYGGHWYEYVLGCIRRMPGGALRRLRSRTLRRGRRGGSGRAPGARRRGGTQAGQGGSGPNPS